MKKLFILFGLVVIAALAVCACELDLSAEKAKVNLTINQFNLAAKNNDMDSFSQIMAHDADMVTFGTGAEERFVGWEALQTAVAKQFATFKNVDLSVGKKMVKVHKSGQVAWFSMETDCSFEVEGKAVSIKGLRTTGVLEKRGGNWIIVQYHNSIPAAE